MTAAIINDIGADINQNKFHLLIILFVIKVLIYLLINLIDFVFILTSLEVTIIFSLDCVIIGDKYLFHNMNNTLHILDG